MKKSVPTVTRIIDDLGLGMDWAVVPSATLDAKAILGTSVHKLCSDYAKGRLRLTDSPADDYAKQFVIWMRDSGAAIRRSEFTVKATVSGLYYIGHPDLEFVWANQVWLTDIKTGIVHESHELQLAGYAAPISPERRGILHLTPSRATLIPIPKDKYKLADQAWAACCTLYRWRHQC